MTEKKYKIQITGKREYVVEGTLDELKETFGRDIFNGNQLNPKIKAKPKNIKEFVTALQKSFNAMQAANYNKTFVDLVE